MVLVNIRNASLLEPGVFGDPDDMKFVIELDQITTAEVKIEYFRQTVSAIPGIDFFDRASGTITIPVGVDTFEFEVPFRRDTAVEGDETVNFIFLARENAEFADNAAALLATGTVYDEDDSGNDPADGPGDYAEPIFGPAAEPGFLPTLDVRGINVIESNASTLQANYLLVTLDRPATADVNGFYTVVDRSATAGVDFSPNANIPFTIKAGEQSIRLGNSIRRDDLIEPDEDYQLFITGVTNAVLPDNAAALAATITIFDGDAGPTDPGGFADISTKIQGASSASDTLPTVRVQSSAVVEDGFVSMRFLVTLDEASDVPIAFTATTNERTASTGSFGSADFQPSIQQVSILAGQRSVIFSTTIYDDNIVEGDEEFSVVLTGLINAVFEGNAPALEVVATILDDDSGPVSGPGGVGDAALLIEGPAQSGSTNVLDIIDTSVVELDTNGASTAFVYLLLAEPAESTVTVNVAAVSGSATLGVDFVVNTTSVTIQVGQTSAYVPVAVIGDNSIEGDEAFTLEFSNLQGAVFAGGKTTATVEIIGDDGAGTSDTAVIGPDFDYFVAPIDGTAGNDVLNGTGAADSINGFGGNDIIRGEGGNDRISAGKGNDQVFGGSGNDYVRVGGGRESFFGGSGNDYISYFDSSNGITANLAEDTISGSWAVNDIIDSFESIAGSRTGADSIIGTSGANTIRTYGGNDRVAAGSGSDRVELGSGNDYVRVGGGAESFYGGSGKDWISYYDSSNGVNINLATNSVSGSWAVNDIVEDFESVSGSRTGDDSIIGTSGSNTIRTFGGDDRVAAGGGTDRVDLGDGDDYVRVGGGKETFDGGSGTDYISYFDSSNGIRIDLRDDEVSGSWAVNDKIEDFEGASGSGTGDDVMLGTNGANALRGFGGDDKLYGRGGSDKLYGGSGEDFLDGGGGSGTDLLYGGSGADVFEFDRGEGVDVIKDFENNIDQINLDNFGFSTSEAYDFAEQVGSDVVFDFGSDGMLTIENTTIGRLQNDLDVV